MAVVIFSYWDFTTIIIVFIILVLVIFCLFKAMLRPFVTHYRKGKEYDVMIIEEGKAPRRIQLEATKKTQYYPGHRLTGKKNKQELQIRKGSFKETQQPPRPRPKPKVQSKKTTRTR